MGDLEPETVVKIDQIIEAAAQNDLEGLQKYINEYSFVYCEAVDVQHPRSGFSPLHAAVSSAHVETNDEVSSEENHNQNEQQDKACETVRFLLENGAIWNQLDSNDKTPGCIAYRYGLNDLYQLMVDAGVRAEILINRLDGYEELADEEQAESDGEKALDSTNDNVNADEDRREDVNGESYLSSRLSRTENSLLDSESNAVMMAWESSIMQKSADAILYEPGLQILNIGFGMGIIDTYIQNHRNKPSSHHIIEAHPEVLAEMRKNDWYNKAGVIIHDGKWQDILPKLLADQQIFDSIYFDTFAESYTQFRDFFTEHVIGLLNETGKWSYFNGMGADRQISYDVYQKVVELDLFESGFDVEWIEIDLPNLDSHWEGIKRKYWNISQYRLPICKFMT